MQRSSLPWWRTDLYQDDIAIPSDLTLRTGPAGPALVAVHESGTTQSGWGLQGKKRDDGSHEPGFMHRYAAREFHWKKALHHFNKSGDPFAFVMRSLAVVCIDIDGKNGGLEHAKQLGPLPVTLAETSKSGDGYHLFFATPTDQWDDVVGFAQYDDHIGIVQGVDIRSVGCVFHYASQLWNDAPIAELPEYLADMMRTRKQKRHSTQARVAKIQQTGDPMDMLVLHDELTTELAKPIPAGKRNNTLFAIGSQMRDAGVDDWETKVYQRAINVGLDPDEADKLVRNITAYKP